jgi:hypothetical protein
MCSAWITLRQRHGIAEAGLLPGHVKGVLKTPHLMGCVTGVFPACPYCEGRVELAVDLGLLQEQWRKLTVVSAVNYVVESYDGLGCMKEVAYRAIRVCYLHQQ